MSRNWHKWTEEEDRKLREMHPKMKNRDIAMELGLSYYAVRCRITALGLIKPKYVSEQHRKNAFKQNYWTPEEDEILKDLLNVKTDREIGEILGRSRSSIKGRKTVLGLRRPAELCRDRKEMGRFKKGHVPANKGKKGVRYSPATEFKKGHKPHNTKRDGEIVVRRNKKRGLAYKYIRISESNWVMLHRHIWEQKHGKIPDDRILVFKNGNQMDCRIENLELIDRKEHVSRNSGNHLTDKHVATYLAGWKNKEMKEEILRNHPDLIKIKREQLKLRREINEREDN